MDYLKTVFGESWKDANDMFVQFDKEGYNIPAPDYSAGGTKQCPSPAAAHAGIPPASSRYMPEQFQVPLLLVLLQGGEVRRAR